MRTAAMDRWAEHCGFYFKQDPKDCIVLHPRNRQKFHIDLLLWKPTEEYPFYKLCTMGASDYKLPLTLCRRNEFVMFIPREENLQDPETLSWYSDVLLSVADYPAQNHLALTFGHSIIWGQQPGTDMFAAYLELPYPIDSPGFLRCRLGFLEETDCLQVVLLTRQETESLLKAGPQKLCDFLYPDHGKAHFLCERYRSNAF